MQNNDSKSLNLILKCFENEGFILESIEFRNAKSQYTIPQYQNFGIGNFSALF